MKNLLAILVIGLSIANVFLPHPADAQLPHASYQPEKADTQLSKENSREIIRNEPNAKKDSNGKPGGATYSVGDFAHGGIVFWIDATGQHGLVCSKTDQSTGIRWYAGKYSFTMAYGDGPFAGKMNTALIIANQSIGDGKTYAARICNELQITEGGKTYGDWYLPSKQELNLMYQNKTVIDSIATANGGAAFSREHNTSYYWSSTEGNRWNWGTPYYAWRQRFSSVSKSTYGSQYDYTKEYELRVRAIRSF